MTDNLSDKVDTMDENDTENNDIPTIAEDEEIGHIVTADDKVTISLDKETRINAFIYKEQRDNIQAGSYLQIPTDRIYNKDELTDHLDIDKEECLEQGFNDEILAIVKDLNYINTTGLNEYRKNVYKGPNNEGTKEHYPLVAKLEIISLVTKDSENYKPTPYKPMNLNIPPKPLTKVYHANDEDFLITGLKIPEKGIRVGYMSISGQKIPQKNPILYKLKNYGYKSDEQSIIWRHCLICGSTGTGKTHTSKNILRQIHKSQKYSISSGESETKKAREPCIIIIDPESEYGQMKEDPDINNEKIRKLKNQGVKVGGVDNLKIFHPEINNNNPIEYTQESQSFGLNFDIVKNRPEILFSFDTGHPTQQAIENVLGEYFHDNDTDNSYQELTKWINEENREEMLKDKYNIGDRMWSATLRRLVGDAAIYRSVFDTSTSSLNDIIESLVKGGQISVIPTKHMNSEQQKLVVLSIMSVLADNKMSKTEKDGETIQNTISNTPILLAIDEAHNYLSADTSTIRDNYILNKFINIAKQGRKYRFGLLPISQNPEDIHPEIIKQCNTRIYLGLEGEIVQNLNVNSEIKEKVQNFDKGQMMVKSPGVRPVEIKGFEVCTVKHE